MALDPRYPGTEGGVFTSFKTIELVLDSTEKERTGLAVRRLKRLLAPASQENPIFMHLTANPTDTKAVEAAIDQMQAVGFEMIIFSFGSGFQIESTNEDYIAKIKASIDYAKSHGGIEVGAYDLIALTRNPPNASWASISPTSGAHDGNACFASAWRDFLLAGVLRFINQTGLSAIETDGPYGGQPCASEEHEHHKGLSDSVYRENTLQARFYQQLKAANLYIHAPDNYYYWGQSKSGMGYNENQYSMSRWVDLQISRAGMFDDTFFTPNTAGWMFVPIQPYHAGGGSASFAPLGQHLEEFEWALAQYFGFGVMPCWRGPALFDDAASQAAITKWVSFYKTHRAILSSDLIHLRRADHQGIDAILHVNPSLTTKVRRHKLEACV